MTKQYILLFDIDYTLFDTAEYKRTNLTVLRLFEEIEELLQHLHKKHTLGILSEGDPEFQKNKLLQTEIFEYFNELHIHIVIDKLGSLPDILKKYQTDEVFLVDDKLPVLYNAKKILPSLKTIWVKRGMYAEQQQPIPEFSPDAEVLDLANLVDILETLQ